MLCDARSGEIPAEPRLSVAIVYFNNADLIASVLPTTLRSVRGAATQCFLIDNASTDATSVSLEEVKGCEDQIVCTIRSNTNVGFGRAHNLVLERLCSEYHLICNPDIIIDDPSTLKKCIDFLDRNADVGMMTIKLLNGDGTLQAANKRNPNVLDLILRRAFPRSQWSWIERRMVKYEMRDVGYDHVTDVPFMPGSFLMVRTKLLQSIGGFDHRYFLYFEDADLGRMIQSKGLRTVYFPGATVMHLWARAAHKDIKMAGILAANGARYFAKWGWRWW